MDDSSQNQPVSFTRHPSVRHGLCALLSAVAAWALASAGMSSGVLFVGVLLVGFVANTLGERMAQKHT